MSKATLQRVAAMGAVAVMGGLIVLYLLIAYVTRYTGTGIDRTESAVTWIAIGLMFLALIAAHAVYARILFQASKGKRFGI
jgi:hypothetical protein